jgi:uncharacterized protein with PIN domain
MQQNKNYTNQEIIVEFKKRRTFIERFTFMMAILVGVISILTYYSITPKLLGILLLGLFFIYAFIVNFKKWRCPYCNGHLGKLYIGLKQPKYCPNCGIKLIEDQG